MKVFVVIGSILVVLSLLALPGFSLLLEEVGVEDVNRAIREGLIEVSSMMEMEQDLFVHSNVEMKKHHHHHHKRRGAAQSSLSSRDAAKIAFASRKLAQKSNWGAGDARRLLPIISLINTTLESICPQPITCPNNLKYRPIDGSCHNRLHPDWGKSETPFQRYLPPDYSDGVWEPRKASDGSELASPRAVSQGFIRFSGPEDRNFTLMLMTWGQFIGHDLTKAPIYTTDDGQTPECCNITTGGHLAPNQLHPYCLPIDISQNDSFYRRFNQTCMTFVRSEIGVDPTCTMGPAEQVNGNTHWMDGSTIYGSNAATLATLRTGRGGLHKTTISSEGKELLPLAPNCSDPTCYYSGDFRAQENPQLAITHTLLMREHNRLARGLQVINPQWDDEILFQEARRIVIAQIQHITYNEYLPAFLGKESMVDYKLTTAPMGTFSVYDERSAENPSVWNEFAAAVFRIGHSQVKGSLSLYDENGQLNDEQSFRLSNYFFDASGLAQSGFIDNALRGLTKQTSSRIDPVYTSELTNGLFRDDKPFGLDLVALNIQRGREHGIPDYNAMRVKCGLSKATSFDDLRSEMDSSSLNDLRAVYKSVDDIDLYVGCLAEASAPVRGSLLGATALCVIAQQFALTKNSDRFFYDVGGHNSSFTLGQLDEIRKTSLARIMCDNNNGHFATVQRQAFRTPTAGNAKVDCSAIPSMDLNFWKER